MATYFVELDLQTIGAEMSASLGCQVLASDVREILKSVGYVESNRGWLVKDLRPLMLALGKPERCALGAF